MTRILDTKETLLALLCTFVAHASVMAFALS